MKIDITEFFSARKALRDFSENKNYWTGGALIVRTDNGFQAIPGVYLNDISYSGSRTAVALAEVKAAVKREQFLATHAQDNKGSQRL